jgi:hypothetical protein
MHKAAAEEQLRRLSRQRLQMACTAVQVDTTLQAQGILQLPVPQLIMKVRRRCDSASYRAVRYVKSLLVQCQSVAGPT